MSTTALIGNLKDFLLGLFNQGTQFTPFGMVSRIGNLGGRMDQLAQYRTLTHNVGIGDDIGGTRRVFCQCPKIGKTTGIAQPFVLFQNFRQSHHVERQLSIRQYADGTENQLMVMPVEVIFNQPVGNLFPSLIVQHQSTQDRLFGLDGVRRDFHGRKLAILKIRHFQFVVGEKFRFSHCVLIQ